MGLFPFTSAFKQPPIQWVMGALNLRVKQLGHKADHSPPSSAEVKNKNALHKLYNILHPV